jgi:hypothetical protein
MKEMAMYLDPYTNLIFIGQQRRLREPSVHRRQSAPGDGRHAARRVVVAVWQAIGAVLHWVADLPCDSRERLRSKEQELAMLGITWASDPVHDAALAREITVARRGRLEAKALAYGGSTAVRQNSSQATRGNRRIAIVGS